MAFPLLMLSLPFRISRRLGTILSALYQSFTIVRWKALYPNRLTLGNTPSFGRFFSIHFDSSSSRIAIGDDVQFRDFCQIRSGMNGRLAIGDRVFFNNHCSINCFHEIVIGNDCQFGEAVKFYDINHKYDQPDVLISGQGYSKGAICIGSNCWIGTDVTILKGVTIGDNVVIGAGCVIREAVASNSVVTNAQSLNIRGCGASHGD